MFNRLNQLVAGLAVAAMAAQASAQRIDFETAPDGSTPVDNAALTDAYTIDSGSVRFFFDTNGNLEFDAGVDVLPLFEASNDSDSNPQGYLSADGSFDSDFSADGLLGDFFLRQPDGIGVLPGPFVIDYDTNLPIDQLSGEIWDIDGGANTEQWRVDVLDANNGLLTQQLSPLGALGSGNAPLDSRPWTFEFTDLAALSAPVDRVVLNFVGTKTDGIGLAFNNFDVQVIPEPSAIALTGLGLVLVAGAGLRRRS